MALTLQEYFKQVIPSVAFSAAQNVLSLNKDGATVPFIARYRKEQTGNLDEVQIRQVIDENENYNQIIKRQAFMIKEIESQGNLTDELKTRISDCWDLGELEELYRPFKKKRKTKATQAREAGLEPLANWIWDIGHGNIQPDKTIEVKAKDFLNPSAGFVTYDLVLKGVQDILIDKVSNNLELRALLLNSILEGGKVVSQKTKKFKPNSKYEMYADYNEEVKKLFEKKASHRYLAMRRGWQEGELQLTFVPKDEDVVKQAFINFALSDPKSPVADFLTSAANTSYAASVLPSVSNEVHRKLKDSADDQAITVFIENVKKILLSSPLGPKCVLGVDPGLKTGCKLALVDKAGNYISHTVLKITTEKAQGEGKKMIEDLLKTLELSAVAVGNGTGGREAEAFFRKIMVELDSKVPVVLVNESGASIYSASDVAREEFPDLDLTVRGAISIARRLQDPLAELVKIDPKSIGVGQYQHDVNQRRLKKGLDDVVESCVNGVGIDLNTASKYLLKYISGVGDSIATNIVDFRKQKGLFKSRQELLNIPKFSSKIFEQAAGFLRVYNGENILDSTGIHPERYAAVREMAHDTGVTLSGLVGEGAKALNERSEKWKSLVGEFTFNDIISELSKPGRDPREGFEPFAFRDDIFEVKDLEEGMTCPGIVSNVTNFGAFIDIGVHQDGLVHISEMGHDFVDDPRRLLSPGDHVKVIVLKVDKDKNQISFSMKFGAPKKKSSPKPKREGSKKTFSKKKGAPKRDKKKFTKGNQKPKGKPRSPFNDSLSQLAAIRDQLKK